MEKFIQITSGRGPVECTRVVARVLQILLQEARESKVQAEVIHHISSDLNGSVETAVVKLVSNDLTLFLHSWLGTIQWIGESEDRKHHKRKNWFIGVFEINLGNIAAINDSDITFQAMRSSGSGGQHVNKVSSAIRATHVPTGIQAVAMDSRSQFQNKKLAYERLLDKVNNFYKNTIRSDEVHHWKNQMMIERGNPVRVFRGTDFKSVIKEKNGKYKDPKYRQDYLSD
jgi:peptide chain release factor